MKSSLLTTSVNGISIEVFSHGGGKKEFIHIYGGFHGDEPESVDLAKQLNLYFEKHDVLDLDQSLMVVPVVNPDGLFKHQRVNAHGVDLNRNFPTNNWVSTYSLPKYFPGEKPGTEPEVIGIINLIKMYPPKKIISIHSLIPHQINFDGPAKSLAQAMAKKNHYPVTRHIGYATPGSLGGYAGEDLHIPVITYELAEKISPQKAFKDSLEAFLEAIHFKV